MYTFIVTIFHLFVCSQYKMRAYVTDLAQRMRHAGTARDYGRSIVWPAAPLAARHSVEPDLRRMFGKWRARQVLRKYPRASWPQLRLQIAAAAALRRRRKFWGQERRWLGNYLASSAENSNYSSFVASVNNLRNAEQAAAFGAVLFSAFVRKFNRFNKSADRAILVTEHAVYKLDGCRAKFKNMKRSLELRDLTALSVTPGRDQLVILHTAKGNDLVVALQGEDQVLKEDRVGELVGLLCNRYTQ